MNLLPDYAAWALAGLLLCAALFLLRWPLVQLVRLIVRSSVGLAALALFSQVGQAIGVSLGVNLVNALVLGLLGVPGFGLLLMLQWVLR
ncbi:transcriptional regulator [Pseudoflavonifractor sp. AF19-9AC]|uniref:pro-sigmaK processing inhibitor BofA family protein n=1 Tax=Pseudoflavonifractor sp. AF19-9AC TaxID=2292244 RepID=UPI000E466CD3|nr:pro-sigmaK processing inhibitor BofA family protein [Pseudoflavonifractor sp. AF19-9AC]RHR11212.1 transcriptional regulator [Pseudoflavonifractor sp. AF19-9AC]